MKRPVPYESGNRFSPASLRRELVAPVELGFRHEFDDDNQERIRGIGDAAVLAFGDRLRLLGGTKRDPTDSAKSGVTLLPKESFRRILKAPGSRLRRHSPELATRLILEDVDKQEALIKAPLEVKIGTFIVSRVANAGRGHVLIATIEDASGSLVQEHAAIINAIAQREGVTMELPDFRPHVSLGKITQPMPRSAAFPHAEELTKRYAGTQLSLLPIHHQRSE